MDSRSDADVSSRPVRWGVLGASRFAIKKSVPGFKKSPSTDVVALASRDAGKAAQAAAELGLSKSYGSYEALLADPEIEVIYNPLPNHLHVPWSIAAARAGKHVLCEKPIALDAREAAQLAAVQAETGVLIAEAFMVRHHPQWRRARALIEAGDIGALRAVQCSFSYHNDDPRNIRNIKAVGGGALYDIGCYAVNTARYLFGREPKRVAALCERDPQSDVDRLTSGLVDFQPGQLVFTVGTLHVPHQRVQILGTRKRIEIEIPFNAPPDRPCRILVDDGRDVVGSGVEPIAFDTVDQYALEAEDFSRAVRTGATLVNPIADAIATMRVMDALFRAADSGAWQAL